MPAASATATVTMLSQQHAAGIFANRNLDGPEIGTLVAIIDRAKNLPNLRTMGKQNPYCAARLGKMALKTETDQRGGQTPKWDQELRFTVHESLDYQKLKVSVFNEDKKTDLVGETWVSLDDVLRRGGGQNDAWHDLQNRGKYAGQIRIELTFYDMRPKEEKPVPAATAPRAAVTASADDEDLPEQPRQMRGPRGPPVKRREMPQNNLPELPRQPGGIPPPQQGLRSFHTPPRVGSMADLGAEYQAGQQYAPEDVANQYDAPDAQVDHYGYDTYDQSFDSQHEYPRGEYDEPPHAEFEGVEEHDFAFPDDPQALEAAHVDAQYNNADHDFALPQNNRVQQLTRPAPLPHSASEPTMHPKERYARQPLQPRAPRYPNNEPPLNYAQRQMGPAHGHAHRHSAPAPPSHRERAPHSDPALYTRNTVWDRRPAPSQASQVQLRHESQAQLRQENQAPLRQEVYQDYDAPPEQYQPYAEQPLAAPRRRSANVYPEVPSGDAYTPYQRRPSNPYQQDDDQYQYTAPLRRQSYEPPRQNNFVEQQEPQPQFYSSGTGPQIVKPRAISPNAPRQSQAIRRKSVNRDGADGVVPFSPDSFNAYNPYASAPPTAPTSTPQAGVRSADPRFSPSDPATSGPPSTLHERQSAAALPVPEPGTPIRDAHGKLIDPSDHLPASTHAPEPEKRGADRHRATITATVKTRFGPRDARPAHIATTRTAGYASSPLAAVSSSPPAVQQVHSSPVPQGQMQPSPSQMQPSPLQQREAMAAAARQRLQKRGGAPPGHAHSQSVPLAPSAPGLLNQGLAHPGSGYRVHQGGYSTVPPPVPGKIPLDAVSGADGADMGGYETSPPVDAMGRLDVGQRSPLQRVEDRYGYAGVGGGRGRRSRFGA